MARIQILELPTIYREHGDDETPFAIIIDQVPTEGEGAIDPASDYSNVAQQLGARAILVFHDTVDIPANEITVTGLAEATDGQAVRLRVEPDLTGFQERVEEAVLYAQGRITQALMQPSNGRPTHPDGTPYHYHEIKAGGWGHCDGCQTWGQWTAAEPHQCIAEQAVQGRP